MSGYVGVLSPGGSKSAMRGCAAPAGQETKQFIGRWQRGGYDGVWTIALKADGTTLQMTDSNFKSVVMTVTVTDQALDCRLLHDFTCLTIYSYSISIVNLYYRMLRCALINEALYF